MRKIFAPTRVEDWRKIQNEELRDFFFLSNVIRVIESRRTQWTWHVPRVGKRRDAWKTEGWIQDNIKMEFEKKGQGRPGWVWFMTGTVGRLL